MLAVISTINTLLIVFFFQLGMKLIRKPMESDDDRIAKNNNSYYTTGIFSLLYSGIILLVTFVILYFDYQQNQT